MAIIIVIDPPKDVRPEGAIRADVAWKLYLPDSMGDLPGQDGTRQMVWFNNWLWGEFSTRLGYLRKDGPDPVWILTPPLTEAALSYLVRTSSIWTDEVHVVRSENGSIDLENRGENVWKVPSVNILESDASDPAMENLRINEEGLTDQFLSPLLGSTRSFMRVYLIPPGGTYARMHSHTAREETYIVLEGKGTVRYGKSSSEITKGDLISKPLGPDVPTQLLADRGESLRILDIEIWPDTTRMSKDLVHYPDHGELDLFGPGWDILIPDKAVFPIKDSMKNYDTGYTRNVDGTWEPRDIPGFKKREHHPDS